MSSMLGGKAKIIDIKCVPDPRGCLSVVEQEIDIPFKIKRIYYLHSLSKDAQRGEHAHKELKQLLIPVKGSFNISLDDGESTCDVILDSPNHGLLLKPVIWRKITTIEDNSICLALVSELYSEEDYIRSYNEFEKYVKNERIMSIS